MTRRRMACEHSGSSNAIVWMDRASARKRARAADAALKKGKRFGPLHGVPMSIKESCRTRSRLRTFR